MDAQNAPFLGVMQSYPLNSKISRRSQGSWIWRMLMMLDVGFNSGWIVRNLTLDVLLRSSEGWNEIQSRAHAQTECSMSCRCAGQTFNEAPGSQTVMVLTVFGMFDPILR